MPKCGRGMHSAEGRLVDIVPYFFANNLQSKLSVAECHCKTDRITRHAKRRKTANLTKFWISIPTIFRGAGPNFACESEPTVYSTMPVSLHRCIVSPLRAINPQIWPHHTRRCDGRRLYGPYHFTPCYFLDSTYNFAAGVP